MKRFFYAAALFAACMICAPIFTEAIAAPIEHNAIIHNNTALPAAPADITVAAVPVKFCRVQVRSSIVADDNVTKAPTITSERYHIRC